MTPYPASASRYVGQTIDNGALRIESILGAGSFGTVYRAVDTRTAPRSCLVPPPRAHLHREFHEGRYAFYVYDLCAGDLHSVIRKVAFFREDELIKRVFVQIIDALEYCHSRGVYHRDLKPENILVSAQSGDIDVFVADFGLATTSKMTASSCGTPCFMSPESLVPRHEPYSTVHGDIWALGCILAEMIGSVRPWSLASPEDDDYSDYLMDRAVLFDILPVSHSAYLLLRKIFSTKPECRPSLAAIRAEVLALDTFFLTKAEAAECGWADRLEKQMLRKMRACGAGAVAPATRRSSETFSSSGSFETCSLGSSSGSCYSNGSSSSAFDSSSAESSELPATPPAPVVNIIRTMDKTSHVVLAPRVAAPHSV
ncbi:kinase-like domain-containing protein [Lactarius akahatsu]|uniref:non-specific serine/threonine protein kinase n=1 Tax=Lactarius akahatsu TaxID=416441 RepID=A0AAD4QCT2_9AGAM|nr:kinase-like domain-containing protein [Lactarius akahatsu]